MKKRLLAIGVLLVALGVVLLAQATYPSGIASFSTRVNGTVIDASWFNSLQNEVIAIETGLINGFQHVLKPQASATYDLGTSSLQWRNAYLSGTLYQGSTNPYTGWTTVTSTNTGTQNDFAPGLVGNTVVRMNNASVTTITGFAGGYDGQFLEVDNVGGAAGQVDFQHQTGSIAANQLSLVATTGKTSLSAGGMAVFRYDGTATKWRLVRHEQGAWITPTFSAGDYTAQAGNWTVIAGNVTTCRYRLVGRSLRWELYVVSTNVSSTPSHLDRVAFGYTVQSTVASGQYTYNDAAGGFVAGMWDEASAGTTLRFWKVGFTGSFTLTAGNNTQVVAGGEVEVQ